MDIIQSLSIDGGNPANEFQLFFDKDVLGIIMPRWRMEQYIKLNKIVGIEVFLNENYAGSDRKKGELRIETSGKELNTFYFDIETEYKKTYVFFKKLLEVWKKIN